MHAALLILRWIGALFVAFHVYVLALVFAIWVTRHFGRDFDTSIAFATAVAVIAGATVVPREQRRSAVLALSLVALLYPAWMFLRAAASGELDAGGLSALLYTLSGSALAYYLMKTVFAGRDDGRTASGHRTAI
jgi:hypothetical protein